MKKILSTLYPRGSQKGMTTCKILASTASGWISREKAIPRALL